MIIGIDIRMLARGTRTGIEEYTINLLSSMTALDANIKYKLFYNGYKKTQLEYDFLSLPNVELLQFKIPNRALDISSRFFHFPKIDDLLGKVDIFFSPHIFLSSLSEKCPFAATFHDLSFERYPEFYSFGKNYWHFLMNPKGQAKRAKKIIAVSESTKEDMIELYNISPEKIKVIYSGINKNREASDSEISKIKKKYRLPDKYILYLGTLEPRKNIIGLIKAFEKIKQKPYANNLSLVIAGSKGWLYKNIFKAVNKSPAKNSIIFTGFIDEKDKHVLYNLADFFIYISFYEGFGFPPLEAMSAGTPVITSNFSSLPEAVEDAAITVNPYNLYEIEKGMELILTDKNIKNILIKKGIERAKKFSWQNCAKETLDYITK